MLEMVTDITEGRGEEGDIERLERLAGHVKAGSLCALGGTAPNPVLTTLEYFRDEYEAHVRDGRCPAGECTALTHLFIDPELCTGCMACVRYCPTDAISGEKKEPHVIDVEACIDCGACVERCRFDAIYRTSQAPAKQEEAEVGA
jgi:NADP-reducing hydrogenase subunit HndC